MSIPDPPDSAHEASPESAPDAGGPAHPEHRRWWTPAGVSALAGVAAVAVALISVFVSLPRDSAAPDTASPSAADAVHVFVYGSSMPGESRYAEIKEYVESSTRAVVDGLLYDSGLGYPAAKFEPGGEVPGFLLTLEASTADAFLREQTALESGLFVQVDVQTHSGVTATAWEWIGATDGMPRIDAWDGSTAAFGQSVFIRELSVGDCFSNSDGRVALTAWCEAPHGYEVLHVESLPTATYSADAIEAAATERCDQAFEDSVGESPSAVALAVERFVPSKDEWDSGDRVVLCALFEPESLLVGPIASW